MSLNYYMENDDTVTLPTTGTYVLAVAGQNASQCSVSYSFEVFDNVNPTSALTLGTTVTGTIANPGDEATYTFTGSAGQRIYFDGLASASYYVFAELDRPERQPCLQQRLQHRRGPVHPDLLGHLHADDLQLQHDPRARGLTASRCTTRRRRRASA